MNVKVFTICIFTFICILSCEDSSSNKKVNQVPVITSVPVLSIKAGFEFKYIILIEDDDDSVTITMDEDYDWLTLSGNVLMGIPTEAGKYTITIHAFDSKNSVVQKFVLEVVDNIPPNLIVQRELFEMNYNQSKTIEIETYDADNEDVSITITSIPDFVSFNSNDNSFSIIPELDDVGSHDIRLTLSDGLNNRTFTIEVKIIDTWSTSVAYGFPQDVKFNEDAIYLAYHYSVNSSTQIGLVKFDHKGNEIWNIDVESRSGNNKADIELTPNGNIAIKTTSYSKYSYITYYSPEGNKIWEVPNIHRDSIYSSFFNDITTTMDNGVVLSRNYRKNYLDTQYVSTISKYSSTGNFEWEYHAIKYIDSTGVIYTSVLNNDGKIFAIGQRTNAFGLNHFYASEFDENGTIVNNFETFTPTYAAHEGRIVNKFENTLNIYSGEGLITHIINMSDWIIKSEYHFRDERLEFVNQIDNDLFFFKKVSYSDGWNNHNFVRRDLTTNQNYSQLLIRRKSETAKGFRILRYDNNHLLLIYSHDSGEYKISIDKSSYDGKVY